MTVDVGRVSEQALLEDSHHVAENQLPGTELSTILGREQVVDENSSLIAHVSDEGSVPLVGGDVETKEMQYQTRERMSVEGNKAKKRKRRRTNGSSLRGGSD